MNNIKASTIIAILFFPGFANASGFQAAFLDRCLIPLMEGGAFDTSGLVDPVALRQVDIGIDGVVIDRTVWRSSDPNWTFGTMESGALFRGCGVSLSLFDGEPIQILQGVMEAIQQTSDICQFDLTYQDLVGYRAVVQKTDDTTSILINFSPVEGDQFNLLAWEAGQSAIDGACLP